MFVEDWSQVGRAENSVFLGSLPFIELHGSWKILRTGGSSV